MSTVDALSAWGGGALGHLAEIVLVVDGSAAARTEAEACARAHRSVVVVDLLGNVGQHRATAVGCRLAAGRSGLDDVVVTVDEDGEHRPGDIDRLLRCRRDTGADVVYGVDRSGHNRRGMIAGVVLGAMQTLGLNRLGTTSSFRALSVGAIRRLRPEAEAFYFDIDLLGLQTAVVSVTFDDDGGRRSSYSLRSRWRHAVGLAAASSGGFTRVRHRCGAAAGIGLVSIGAMRVLGHRRAAVAPVPLVFGTSAAAVSANSVHADERRRVANLLAASATIEGLGP